MALTTRCADSREADSVVLLALTAEPVRRNQRWSLCARKSPSTQAPKIGHSLRKKKRAPPPRSRHFLLLLQDFEARQGDRHFTSATATSNIRRIETERDAFYDLRARRRLDAGAIELTGLFIIPAPSATATLPSKITGERYQAALRGEGRRVSTAVGIRLEILRRPFRTTAT